MLFNVPQYTDIEDKVAGPLTAKQLLWMFGMGAILLVLWNLLDTSAFFFAAIPVAALFCAFAFWKPNGEPLINFFFYGIRFLFSPKTYTWKREPIIKKRATQKKRIPARPVPNKVVQKMSTEDIAALAGTLDSDGMERSKRIEDLIKARQQGRQ